MEHNNSDKLLESFTNLQIDNHDLGVTFGGATSGNSSDPDGCTAAWFDLNGGGYYHTEDQSTCD